MEGEDPRALKITCTCVPINGAAAASPLLPWPSCRRCVVAVPCRVWAAHEVPCIAAIGAGAELPGRLHGSVTQHGRRRADGLVIGFRGKGAD